MDLQDFLKKFAEEIGVAPEKISAETRFRTLPTWTSLQALMVLSMIEEEFGVLLHSEDFKKSETLGDIFRIVVEKKN